MEFCSAELGTCRFRIKEAGAGRLRCPVAAFSAGPGAML